MKAITANQKDLNHDNNIDDLDQSLGGRGDTNKERESTAVVPRDDIEDIIETNGADDTNDTTVFVEVEAKLILERDIEVEADDTNDALVIVEVEAKLLLEGNTDIEFEPDNEVKTIELG